jgi:hypothetical protein
MLDECDKWEGKRELTRDEGAGKMGDHSSQTREESESEMWSTHQFAISSDDLCVKQLADSQCLTCRQIRDCVGRNTSYHIPPRAHLFTRTHFFPRGFSSFTSFLIGSENKIFLRAGSSIAPSFCWGLRASSSSSRPRFLGLSTRLASSPAAMVFFALSTLSQADLYFPPSTFATAATSTCTRCQRCVSTTAGRYDLRLLP